MPTGKKTTQPPIQLPDAPPTGGPRVRAVPPGDERERLICPDCGYIAYQNPLIVVGSVTTWEDGRILLCRRAIEPQKGLWTLPAGFMEERETTAQGAMREAWEEARARIEIDCMLALYDLPRISQVQILFRARLQSLMIGCGPESSEVDLFTWDDIPWGEIAFPTVRWALFEHRDRIGLDNFPPALPPTLDQLEAWERELEGS